MKNTFIFDASENDIINLDETTVIKTTGVNTNNIKVRVLKEIKNGKKPVRVIRKKTVFSIIAAAAAVAVLGTITVGAAGGFSQNLSEFFAGEPADGVFSGKDVVINSDKLDIDFAGIAGDDNQVVAMMKIKSKDGNSFVKTADNAFIGNYDIDPDRHYNVSIKQTAWDSVFHPVSPDIGEITYSFQDENTICAVVVCTSDKNGHIKGQRLNASDNIIYAYTPVETICSIQNDDGSVLDEMNKKYKNKISDNQVIRYSEDNKSVIIAEKTKISLDYEMGVTLNYRSTTRNIESSAGKKYTMNNSEWEVDYISANSFTLDLSAHTWELPENSDYNLANIDNQDEKAIEKYNQYIDSFYPDNLVVTLDSGKKYTAVTKHLGTTGGGSFGEGFGEIYISFEYIDENGSISALNPDSIVSITLNGTELMA